MLAVLNSEYKHGLFLIESDKFVYGDNSSDY